MKNVKVRTLLLKDGLYSTDYDRLLIELTDKDKSVIFTLKLNMEHLISDIIDYLITNGFDNMFIFRKIHKSMSKDVFSYIDKDFNNLDSSTVKFKYIPKVYYKIAELDHTKEFLLLTKDKAEFIVKRKALFSNQYTVKKVELSIEFINIIKDVNTISEIKEIWKDS